MGLFDGARRPASSPRPRTSPGCSTRRCVLVVDAASAGPLGGRAGARLRHLRPRRADRRRDPQPGRLATGTRRSAATALEETGLPVLGVLRRATRRDARRATWAWSRPPNGAPRPSRRSTASARWSPTRATCEAARSRWPHTAGPLAADAWDPAAEPDAPRGRPRIAVAGGAAFTFRYAETRGAAGGGRGRGRTVRPAARQRAAAGDRRGRTSAAGSPRCYAAELSANEPLRRRGRRASDGPDLRRVRRACCTWPGGWTTRRCAGCWTPRPDDRRG